MMIETTWKERKISFKPEKVMLSPKDSFFSATFSPGPLTLGKKYRMIVSVKAEDGYIPSEAFLDTIAFRPYLVLKSSAGVFFDKENCRRNRVRVEDTVTLTASFVYEPSSKFDYEDHSKLLAKTDMDTIGIELYAYSRVGTEKFVYTVDSFAEEIDLFEKATGEEAKKLEAEWYASVRKAADSARDGLEMTELAPDKITIDQEDNCLANGWFGTDLPEIKPETTIDMVNHPPHYNATPIDTWEMFSLMFHDRPEYLKGALLFNTLKYKDRAGRKDGTEQDIQKMLWHLKRFEAMFPDDAILYNLYHDLRIKK